MDEDNRKDICNEEIDYSYIALISKKLRIGIVGGGRAGVIKTKHFIENKCYVEVLSKSFDKEIIELAKKHDKRLRLIYNEFTYDFLKDKHLIIIALDDENLKNQVKKYCDENYKLYIDSSEFKNGMGTVPIQRSTKSATFALGTKIGNPKGAIFLASKVKNLLEEYDEFIIFAGEIRRRAKKFPKYKGNIVSIVNSDDFKKVFDEGNCEKELKKSFPKEVVDYLLKNYMEE